MSQHFAADLLLGKRFLVFGASGGAGSAVCREIEACSGEVVAFRRDKDKLGDTRDYDGVFFAAGMEVVRPLTHIQPFEINGPSSLLQHVLGCSTTLVKRGGSIVVMSSAAAVHGTPGMVVYGAHKAFAEGLVRGAAIELAPKRIRVNAIRAGGFTSPMHQRVTSKMSAASLEAYAAKHPLGFGTCEDVANAAVFLLSDAAGWITGTCMDVDGGFGAR